MTCKEGDRISLDQIPIFSLKDTHDQKVSEQLEGSKYFVLYFYPKDDTPGCTIEAKEFSELKGKFEEYGAKVYGISKDSLESHKKFAKKHDLTIGLLEDNSEISEKLGIFVEKSMYGKKYFGIERTTFVIDTTGKILKIWNKVTPKDHASDVLGFIKSLE
ncbi:MAG: peroxiredoxin [Rickettsiaceae bacterium]|nr:peroxiredoxin [Rickettsiaceae bacterium]